MESGATRRFKDWRFTKLEVTMDYDLSLVYGQSTEIIHYRIRPIDGSPTQDSPSSWADGAVETEGNDRMTRSENTKDRAR